MINSRWMISTAATTTSMVLFFAMMIFSLSSSSSSFITQVLAQNATNTTTTVANATTTTMTTSANVTNATSSTTTWANTTSENSTTSANWTSTTTTTDAPNSTTSANGTTTTAAPVIHWINMTNTPSVVFANQAIGINFELSAPVPNGEYLTITGWYNNQSIFAWSNGANAVNVTAGSNMASLWAQAQNIPANITIDFSISGSAAAWYQFAPMNSFLWLQIRAPYPLIISPIPLDIENGTTLNISVTLGGPVPENAYVMINPSFNAGINGFFEPAMLTFMAANNNHLTQYVLFHATSPTMKATTFDWHIQGMGSYAYNGMWIIGGAPAGGSNIVVPTTTTTAAAPNTTANTTAASTTVTTAQPNTTTASSTTAMAQNATSTTSAAPVVITNTTTAAPTTTNASSSTTTTVANSTTVTETAVPNTTTVSPPPSPTSTTANSSAASTTAASTTSTAAATTSTPTPTTTAVPATTPGWLVIKMKDNKPLTEANKTAMRATLSRLINYPSNLISIGEPDANGDVTISLLAPSSGAVNATEIEDALEIASTLTTTELGSLGAAQVTSTGTPAPTTTNAPEEDKANLGMIIGLAVAGVVLLAIILYVIKMKSSGGTGTSSPSSSSSQHASSPERPLNRMENEMAQHNNNRGGHNQQQARYIDNEL